MNSQRKVLRNACRGMFVSPSLHLENQYILPNISQRLLFPDIMPLLQRIKNHPRHSPTILQPHEIVLGRHRQPSCLQNILPLSQHQPLIKHEGDLGLLGRSVQDLFTVGLVAPRCTAFAIDIDMISDFDVRRVLNLKGHLPCRRFHSNSLFSSEENEKK